MFFVFFCFPPKGCPPEGPLKTHTHTQLHSMFMSEDVYLSLRFKGIYLATGLTQWAKILLGLDFFFFFLSFV